MSKQCLHMKNLFFQINNIYWCKQSRKHDRKPLWFQKFIQNNQSMKKTQVCSCIAPCRKAKTKVETSILRTLEIMPRNLNPTVRS